MRTTITLPDRLLEAAKRRAQERDTTLSVVVADALRLALTRPSSDGSTHFKLVTFRGDGTLPGVDLARSSELYALDDVDVLQVSDSRKHAPRPERRRARKRR